MRPGLDFVRQENMRSPPSASEDELKERRWVRGQAGVAGCVRERPSQQAFPDVREFEVVLERAGISSNEDPSSRAFNHSFITQGRSSSTFIPPLLH